MREEYISTGILASALIHWPVWKTSSRCIAALLVRVDREGFSVLLAREGIMAQCDMLEECKLYQKLRDTENEIWIRIKERCCIGPEYGMCTIRRDIIVHEVNMCC